jgi:hypothetical protein
MMAEIAFEDGNAPFLPRDIFHNIISAMQLMTCHAPGKQTPLKKSHPPREECMLCHKAEQPRLIYWAGG